MSVRDAVSVTSLVLVLVALAGVWQSSRRLTRVERDTWVVIPELVQRTCVMEETRQGTRGRFVLVSLKNPDHCTLAEPGGHPKVLLFGIMLDDVTFAGAPALLLGLRNRP